LYITQLAKICEEKKKLAKRWFIFVQKQTLIEKRYMMKEKFKLLKNLRSNYMISIPIVKIF